MAGMTRLKSGLPSKRATWRWNSGSKPTHLVRDNDGKFSIRSTLECLDQFLVFGEDHFRHLIEAAA